MLSYQHGYHAGNFADVLKHLGLSRLFTYLAIKDNPFFYLETHAGKGLYDLGDKQAAKTGEYLEGIQKIWDDRKNQPALFQDYLTTINSLNKNKILRFYPGSPYLAIQALRTQDRGYLCELHPQEFAALNQLAHFNKKIYCSESDGISALKALLPPAEKRGLIFIDPSYELKDEYKTIPTELKQAHNRFATGIYCLWYPVVNRRLTDQLIRRFQDIPAPKKLKVEFNLTLAPKDGMTGCGLLIINPPYTFSEDIKIIMDKLRTYFNPGVSSYLIEPL